MLVSDWILVATTVFLGSIALIAPVISEAIKRKYFAPKLKVTFERTPPYCHKTYWRNQNVPNFNEPVYYFRFQLANDGKSQLRNVEAVLEELWVHDTAGLPQKFTGFSDINLHWSGKQGRFVDINPGRQFYCDIGHISSPKYQKNAESKHFIDIPGQHQENNRFLLDLLEYPYSQPNCLIPGKYSLKISLYSENAPPKTLYFEIAWSGNWQGTEEEMFRELSISPKAKVNGV